MDTSHWIINLFYLLPPSGPKTVFFWAPIMKWVSIICQLVFGCQSEGNLQQPVEQAAVSQQISEPTERCNTKALIFHIHGGTKLALITYSTTCRGYSRGKMLCGKIVLFAESFMKALSCETLTVAQGGHELAYNSKPLKHVFVLRLNWSQFLSHKVWRQV